MLSKKSLSVLNYTRLLYRGPEIMGAGWADHERPHCGGTRVVPHCSDISGWILTQMLLEIKGKVSPLLSDPDIPEIWIFHSNWKDNSSHRVYFWVHCAIVQCFVYHSILIFWIVVGCGIARYLSEGSINLLKLNIGSRFSPQGHFSKVTSQLDCWSWRFSWSAQIDNCTHCVSGKSPLSSFDEWGAVSLYFDYNDDDDDDVRLMVGEWPSQ